MDLKDRLMSQLVLGQNECWLWTGGCFSEGYGALYVSERGSNVGTHRLAYELFIGPIPKDHHVHHVCGVRNCCNPVHLEAKPPMEHARDHQEEKTHCKRGHELAGDNLYVFPATGFRRCKICYRAGKRAKRNGTTVEFELEKGGRIDTPKKGDD